MAKAVTTPHAAIAAGFKINGFAIFNGYTALEEGQEQILEKGAPVRVDRFENDADIVVIAVDDEGNDIMSDDGITPKFAERVFPEELTPAELDPDGDDVGASAPVETPLAEEVAAPATKPETAAAKKKRENAAAKEAAIAEKAANAAANKAKATKAKEDKKVTAPAQAIKATPVVQITDMTSVMEILAEQDALTAAKSLVDRAEQTDFTLGGVLRHIHESGAFKSIGYDGKRGFDDYVKAVLDVDPRKARYLMTIYTAFALIGVDEAKLSEIGWSKAKELARIETGQLRTDFNALYDKAMSMTRDDLIADIKKHYRVTTRGSSDSVSLTKFSFMLAEEDAVAVNEGLAEAAALVGDTDLNKAFAYIVGDWRNTGTGTDLSLEDTLELACARFGLTAITITQADGTNLEFEPDVVAGAEVTS